MHRKRRLQQGVTLIECLVALLVLGMGSLGVLKLQSTFRVQLDAARHRMEALQLVHRKLEQLRRVVSEVPAPSPAITAVAGNDLPNAGSNATFTRRWSVTPATDGRALALIDVEVTVSGRSGRPIRFAMRQLETPTDADATGLAAVAAAKPPTLPASPGPAATSAETRAEIGTTNGTTIAP